MKAVLYADKDPRILKLFAPEDKDFPRGSYKVSEDEDSVLFTMQAEDAAAMRAIFNSITKTLTIWEGSESI